MSTAAQPAPEEPWVGRRGELESVLRAVRDLAGGRGGLVLAEGEAGIGKSALVRAALRTARTLGCQVFHADADELTARFPLQVLADGLQMRGLLPAAKPAPPAGAPPPAVAPPTAASSDEPHVLVPDMAWTLENPVFALAERLLTRVDEACAAMPVVLAIDDVQWADEASLAVLARLAGATTQMALLLVATCRPTPQRSGVSELRRVLVAQGGLSLTLGPLSETESVELAGLLVGAQPGPVLRRRLSAAGGNPLYLRETVDALVRDDDLRIAAGVAEVSAAAPVTVSLARAICDRLDFLSDSTRQVLRLASLLGVEFPVTHLAAVAAQTPTALIPVIDESVTGGVLAPAGNNLRFRHGLIRVSLYESMPHTLRSAIHRQIAEALTAGSAPVETVAAHLLQAPDDLDPWAIKWIVGHRDMLVARDPQTAQDLLGQAVAHPLTEESARPDVDLSLATAAFRTGSHAVLAEVGPRMRRDGASAGHCVAVAWMLAYTLMRNGRADETLALLDEAVADPATPAAWLPRLRSLRGMALLNVGSVEQAEVQAAAALRSAGNGVDPGAAGYTRHLLAALTILRGDVAGAMTIIDDGLAELADETRHGDVRMLLLSDRISWSPRGNEAASALRTARMQPEQAGGAQLTLALAAAGWHYLSGRWDDALAEAAAAVVPTGHSYAHLIFDGLTALIAVRRDRNDEARALVDEVLRRPDAGIATANSIYIRLARSALAERSGDGRRALELLADTLDPENTGLLGRNLLLPTVVRLAVAGGDQETARQAMHIAAQDAILDRDGYRAAAARWCAGILDGDLAELDKCAAYYRSADWLPALANVLEDGAVVAAAAGDGAAARSRIATVVDLYTDLGMLWELSRADARLRALGVRRGYRSRPSRPSTGWDALTRTELRVAELVAEGRSNPDIAHALYLSRRTVQTHVTHILAKLGMRSRVEVARGMAQRPVAAPDTG